MIRETDRETGGDRARRERERQREREGEEIRKSETDIQRETDRLTETDNRNIHKQTGRQRGEGAEGWWDGDKERMEHSLLSSLVFILVEMCQC